jgi:hypothetical protein
VSHNLVANAIAIDTIDINNCTINNKRILTTDDLGDSDYSPNTSLGYAVASCPYVNSTAYWYPMSHYYLGIAENWQVGKLNIQDF